MIFSTGQVVYYLCYSLFLNSNNDIFEKFMANFSEVSYLALNIFSAIKASQFNFSENLSFEKHCFAQSSTELLSYQVSRQQHYMLDKLKKKNNCGSFLCNIPLFLWHLPRFVGRWRSPVLSLGFNNRPLFTTYAYSDTPSGTR